MVEAGKKQHAKLASGRFSLVGIKTINDSNDSQEKYFSSDLCDSDYSYFC